MLVDRFFAGRSEAELSSKLGPGVTARQRETKHELFVVRRRRGFGSRWCVRGSKLGELGISCHHSHVAGKVLDDDFQAAGTGILVSPSRSASETLVVLTAGHVTQGIDPWADKVRGVAGTETPMRPEDSDAEVGFVTKRSIYPGYPSVHADADPAVLRLANPIPLNGTTTRALSLVEAGSDRVEPDDPLLVAGWVDHGRSSMRLHEARAVTVSAEEIGLTQMPGINDIVYRAERRIVASSEDRADASPGDSEGPLYRDDTNVDSQRLLGVVSSSGFVIYNSQSTEYGMYTQVSDYLGWINAEIARMSGRT